MRVRTYLPALPRTRLRDNTFQLLLQAPDQRNTSAAGLEVQPQRKYAPGSRLQRVAPLRLTFCRPMEAHRSSNIEAFSLCRQHMRVPSMEDARRSLQIEGQAGI